MDACGFTFLSLYFHSCSSCEVCDQRNMASADDERLKRRKRPESISVTDPFKRLIINKQTFSLWLSVFQGNSWGAKVKRKQKQSKYRQRWPTDFWQTKQCFLCRYLHYRLVSHKWRTFLLSYLLVAGGSNSTTFTSGLIVDQYKYNDNDYKHICLSLPSRLTGNNDKDVPLKFMLFFKRRRRRRRKLISIVMSCSFPQRWKEVRISCTFSLFSFPAFKQ